MSMDSRQLGKIYSSKEKYLKELDESTNEFKRLLIETIEWKIPHLQEVIPPYFNPDSVAEIGCFVGHLIANILINGNRDFNHFGYDVNPEAIRIAKQLYPYVNFSTESIFDSHLFFDLIILSDIVEHIENDLQFLRDCGKFSNYIVLNLPLEKSISNRKRKYGFDDPSGHLRAYSLSDAIQLIKSTGYEIVNMQVVSVVDSFLYQKRKYFDVKEETYRTGIKKMKFEILKILSKFSLFNKLYYGSNLFAFLQKK